MPLIERLAARALAFTLKKQRKLRVGANLPRALQGTLQDIERTLPARNKQRETPVSIGNEGIRDLEAWAHTCGLERSTGLTANSVQRVMGNTGKAAKSEADERFMAPLRDKR
jgi:hypothetical protein